MDTIDEIYSQMMEKFQSETGIEASGSGDLAVRLYAVAAQIYALEVQGEWVARQCFPQSAEGEYLDNHAQLRGITRQDAACAEGLITFSTASTASADWTIPVGTVCMTAGLVRFETVEEGTLASGESSVTVSAQAVEAGSSGNVSAGSILTMSVAPVGVSSCINSEAFVGGTDEESDEDLRTRVMETYERLQNGANEAYYRQNALDFEGVAQAVVMAKYRGVGTVDVVISTPSGLPDADLIAELTAWFEERREIAVDVLVRAPEVEEVDVSIAVTPASAVDAVEEAIQSWFDGELLGQSILRAKLTALVFSVDGVENCSVLAPTADVVVEEDVLPMLGTLTVTEMGA